MRLGGGTVAPALLISRSNRLCSDEKAFVKAADFIEVRQIQLRYPHASAGPVRQDFLLRRVALFQRPASTTSAPLSASIRAASKPIPALAPLITAVRPF